MQWALLKSDKTRHGAQEQTYLTSYQALWGHIDCKSLYTYRKLEKKCVYLSSLGNGTVPGSDSSDISSASFGIQIFYCWKYDISVLYRLKNVYDYTLNSYYLLLAASYHRNLYEILVPTLILIHRHHNKHNSTMASAGLPSPASTKIMRKNYTMAQVAS